MTEVEEVRQEVNTFVEDLVKVLDQANKDKRRTLENWVMATAQLDRLKTYNRAEFDYILEKWRAGAEADILEKAYRHANNPSNFPQHIVRSGFTTKKLNQLLPEDMKKVINNDVVTLSVGSAKIQKKCGDLTAKEVHIAFPKPPTVKTNHGELFGIGSVKEDEANTSFLIFTCIQSGNEFKFKVRVDKNELRTICNQYKV